MQRPFYSGDDALLSDEDMAALAEAQARTRAIQPHIGVAGFGGAPYQLRIRLPDAVEVDIPADADDDLLDLVSGMAGVDVRSDERFAPYLSRDELLPDVDAADLFWSSPPQARSHVVQAGDTVEEIARATYGENWRAGIPAIVAANKLRLSPERSPIILPNQALLLPSLTGDIAAQNRSGGKFVAENTAGISHRRDLDRTIAELQAALERGDLEKRDFGDQLNWLPRPGMVRNGQLLQGTRKDWERDFREDPAGWTLVNGGLAGVTAAGRLWGLGRGAAHSIRDIGQAGILGARLQNPARDLLQHGPEGWAPVQLWRGGQQAGEAAGNYVISRAQTPRLIGEDLADRWDDFQVRHSMDASPRSDTFAGEAARRFGIAGNQGEMLYDGLSIAVGGPLFKGASKVGHLQRLAGLPRNITDAEAARRLGYGDVAEHWDTAYPTSGMGHHNFGRADAKRWGIPDELVESPFNVVRPDGISRGNMFFLHYGLDDAYYGGPLPRGASARGWSGKKMGLRRYNDFERLWYGSTQATKNAVAAGLLAGQAAGATPPAPE